MLTRRGILKRSFWAILFGLAHPFIIPWKWVSKSCAQDRRLLPKGFPRSKLADMNPAEIDNRDLDIDPLDQFGTMGPTDLTVDLVTFRLKVTGEVHRPLSLSYEEILKLPSVTEDVLLICPGYFSNHGRWTGVHLRDLVAAAQPREGAAFLDIIGYEMKRRIPLDNITSKKIILAYRVNGEPLSKKHGFPLRLVYGDAYGSEWIKYVEEIVVAPWPKPDSQ